MRGNQQSNPFSPVSEQHFRITTINSSWGVVQQQVLYWPLQTRQAGTNHIGAVVCRYTAVKSHEHLPFLFCWECSSVKGPFRSLKMGCINNLAIPLPSRLSPRLNWPRKMRTHWRTRLLFWKSLSINTSSGCMMSLMKVNTTTSWLRKWVEVNCSIESSRSRTITRRKLVMFARFSSKLCDIVILTRWLIAIWSRKICCCS